MKKIRLKFFIPEKSSNIRNEKGSKFVQHQKQKTIQILQVGPENQMPRKGAKKIINAQMIKTQEQNNHESNLTSAT